MSCKKKIIPSQFIKKCTQRLLTEIKQHNVRQSKMIIGEVINNCIL